MEWLRLIEEEDVECTVARAGQRIELAEEIRVEVLHPQATLLQDTTSDINNNSVVVRLIFRDFNLLLTGDIFEEAEQYLLDRRSDLRSSVLKIAHHGSDTSSCSEFLAEVDPEVAVISVRAENLFGHPSPEVVERLSGVQVYRTDRQGTIELITDGQKLWVKTEK